MARNEPSFHVSFLIVLVSSWLIAVGFQLLLLYQPPVTANDHEGEVMRIIRPIAQRPTYPSNMWVHIHNRATNPPTEPPGLAQDPPTTATPTTTTATTEAPRSTPPPPAAVEPTRPPSPTTTTSQPSTRLTRPTTPTTTTQKPIAVEPVAPIYVRPPQPISVIQGRPPTEPPTTTPQPLQPPKPSGSRPLPITAIKPIAAVGGVYGNLPGGRPTGNQQIVALQQTLFGCDGCGNDNNRIVGGYVTKENEFPWMVAIVPVGRHRHCGGSIVNDRYVITAAHCVIRYIATPYLLRVVIGTHNLDRAKHENIHHVSRVFYNLAYLFTPDSDVAVVGLSKPLVFTRTVAPVCLPPEGHSIYGQRGTVIGWGDLREGGPPSDVLRRVDVPITDYDVCKKSYPKEVTTRVICAGFKDGGKDSCQGDSGGPLMWQSNQHSAWYLVGVVSTGNGCAQPHFYGLYTNISSHLSWIRSHTMDGQCSYLLQAPVTTRPPWLNIPTMAPPKTTTTIAPPRPPQGGFMSWFNNTFYNFFPGTTTTTTRRPWPTPPTPPRIVLPTVTMPTLADIIFKATTPPPLFTYKPPMAIKPLPPMPTMPPVKPAALGTIIPIHEIFNTPPPNMFSPLFATASTKKPTAKPFKPADFPVHLIQDQNFVNMIKPKPPTVKPGYGGVTKPTNRPSNLTYETDTEVLDHLDSLFANIGNLSTVKPTSKIEEPEAETKPIPIPVVPVKPIFESQNLSMIDALLSQADGLLGNYTQDLEEFLTEPETELPVPAVPVRPIFEPPPPPLQVSHDLADEIINSLQDLPDPTDPPIQPVQPSFIVQTKPPRTTTTKPPTTSRPGFLVGLFAPRPTIPTSPRPSLFNIHPPASAGKPLGTGPLGGFLSQAQQFLLGPKGQEDDMSFTFDPAKITDNTDMFGNTKLDFLNFDNFFRDSDRTKNVTTHFDGILPVVDERPVEMIDMPTRPVPGNWNNVTAAETMSSSAGDDETPAEPFPFLGAIYNLTAYNLSAGDVEVINMDYDDIYLTTTARQPAPKPSTYIDPIPLDAHTPLYTVPPIPTGQTPSADRATPDPNHYIDRVTTAPFFSNLIPGWGATAPPVTAQASQAHLNAKPTMETVLLGASNPWLALISTQPPPSSHSGMMSVINNFIFGGSQKIDSQGGSDNTGKINV